jgi:hypothetical protein
VLDLDGEVSKFAGNLDNFRQRVETDVQMPADLDQFG